MFSSKQLNVLRLQGDEQADQCIQQLADLGKLHYLNTLIQEYIQGNTVPLVLEQYMLCSAQIPNWIDFELIRRTEKFFALYGPEIAIVLLFKSLPASYTCWRGAKVLKATGYLAETQNTAHFTKRLMETSQYVIDVLSPNAFIENGVGIRSNQKVRLIHAMVRYFLEQKQWDNQTYGVPINQEDMIGTLMAFSVYVLEGLEDLGIKIDEKDKEAFLHTWKIVGYLQGIKESYLPENYEQALSLGYLILNRQKAYTEDTKILVDSYLNFIKEMTQCNVFEFYPKVLLRYLLKDELSDLLHLPKHQADAPMDRLAFKVFSKIQNIKDNSEIIRRIAQKYNRRMLQILIHYFHKNQNITLQIPQHLYSTWRISQKEVSLIG